MVRGRRRSRKRRAGNLECEMRTDRATIRGGKEWAWGKKSNMAIFISTPKKQSTEGGRVNRGGAETSTRQKRRLKLRGYRRKRKGRTGKSGL